MRKSSKGRFRARHVSGAPTLTCVHCNRVVAPLVSFVRTLYKDWNEASSRRAQTFPAQRGQAGRGVWIFRGTAEYAREVPWLEYVPTVSRPWEDTKWRADRARG